PADTRDLHSFPTRRSSDLLNGNRRAAILVSEAKSAAILFRSRRNDSLAAISTDAQIASAIFLVCTGSNAQSPAWHVAVLITAAKDRKSTRLNSSHLGISYA